MAEPMTDYPAPIREPSGRAVAGVTFAATMMIMIGVFQGLAGLVAILRDQFFVVAPNYLYKVDVTTWGWIHLIVGVIMLVAGIYLFAGRLWARIVAITLAILSAISNFLFIPYYPIWALLIIALDVFVIWAVASYNSDVLPVD